MSHRLKALEEEVGLPLFERVGRRLRLTEAGRVLLEGCSDLIARTADLRMAVVGASGTVTIATFPTVTAHLITSAIHELVEQSIAVRFRFGMRSQMLTWLGAGDVDAVLMLGDGDTGGFESLPLGFDHVAVVSRPQLFAGSRLGGFQAQSSDSGGTPSHCGDALSIEDLVPHRYLAWHGGRDPTFDAISAFASKNGLSHVGTPMIPHIETLRTLAAEGLGYTILPAYTAKRSTDRGDTATHRLQGLQLPLPVSLLTRSTTPWHASLRRTVDAVTDSVRSRVSSPP